MNFLKTIQVFFLLDIHVKILGVVQTAQCNAGSNLHACQIKLNARCKGKRSNNTTIKRWTQFSRKENPNVPQLWTGITFSRNMIQRRQKQLWEAKTKLHNIQSKTRCFLVWKMWLVSWWTVTLYETALILCLTTFEGYGSSWENLL